MSRLGDPVGENHDPKYDERSDCQEFPTANERQSSRGLDKYIWDMEDALERVDGDQLFLRDLAELFRLRSQELLAMLAQSLAADDVSGVGDAAHALKGSAAELSAADLVQIARRLEETARNEDFSEVLSQSQSLQQAVKRLDNALRAWLERPGAAPRI